MPLELLPAAPVSLSPSEWAALARLGSAAESGPRAAWPLSWWGGMATSFGLHGAVVAAAVIGWPAGWSLALLPPRNDISSAAQRRGSTALILEGAIAQPEEPTPVVKLAKQPLEVAPREPSPATSTIERIRTLPPRELDYEPVETNSPAGAVPAATAAERTPALESAASPRMTEQAALPRKAAGGAPSLPGTVDSRAARGTKNHAPPRTLFSPDPLYPPALLAARQEGKVLIRIRVAPAGMVTRAVIHQTSGFAAFDRAALEAVNKWRFEPIPGAPAGGIEAIVPVRFDIADE
jgi:protein TonB